MQKKVNHLSESSFSLSILGLAACQSFVSTLCTCHLHLTIGLPPADQPMNLDLERVQAVVASISSIQAAAPYLFSGATLLFQLPCLRLFEEREGSGLQR